MSRVLWYASKPKVELLAQGLSKPIVDQIKLSLKANWFEAKISKDLTPAFANKVERVVKNLEEDGNVDAFERIGDSRPTLFTFAGPAGRLMVDGIFWVALVKPPVALLLVGSGHQAIGAMPEANGAISPSADPVGALSAAFHGDADATLFTRLQYAWETVAERSGLTEGVLPNVYGFAFFAGSFRSPPKANDADATPSIERLVLGSPVYVEQV
jgi:hypothetical protein